MTPSSLANSLQGLRGLVEREEQTINILRTIDSFSIQITHTEKHLSQVEAEVQQLRNQTKKLRNKNKKLENQVCKCQKEKDILAQEFQKAQDIHRFKIQKLLHTSSTISGEPSSNKKAKVERKIRKCSLGTQCQIWSESSIQELQEKSQFLQLRVEGLQKRCEQQFRESFEREDLIHQLLLALQAAQSQPQHQILQEDEKENDNSTLDNDSQKQEDFPLPEWLESVQSESSELVGEEQQEKDEQQKTEKDENSSWLSRLRECSLKLHQFIFG